MTGKGKVKKVMWWLYALMVVIAIVAITIMEKIAPEQLGGYVIYVAVILIILASVFEFENAW